VRGILIASGRRSLTALARRERELLDGKFIEKNRMEGWGGFVKGRFKRRRRGGAEKNL